MDQPERTIADVVARLRRANPDPTGELVELYLAVREIALNSQRLERALKEVAAETTTLAAGADGPGADRLRNLATYTAVLHGGAEQGAAALSELRAGIEAWGL